MKNKAKLSSFYGITNDQINIIYNKSGYGKYFKLKDKEVIVYEYIIYDDYIENFTENGVIGVWTGLTFDTMIKLLGLGFDNVDTLLENENVKICCFINKEPRIFRYEFIRRK